VRHFAALGMPRLACYKGHRKASAGVGKQMGRVTNGRSGPLALLGLSLALGGCGSTDVFKVSALDLFSTSSKATGDNPAGVSAEHVECPSIQVRTGAATLLIGSKPGDVEPSALDVRYQGSIIRTARECHINAGIMTMKVGIEGRVITGPAGGPGTVDVPLRIAVVQEGVEPKAVASKFGRETVTVQSAVDRVTFTHVDPEITFPLPQPLALIDRYVVYVGFDPQSLQPHKPPVKKKPVKPRTVAKPKQS
jgi:hypothetical protein